MANRHKGGRKLSYGNKDVVNEYNQGNAPGVSATAAKGNIKKADGGKVIGKAAGGRLDRKRGGRAGGGSSPFSSAAFKFGGAVGGGNRRP